jgi:predicted ATPase
MSIDFGSLRLDGITIVDVPPLGVIHVPLSSTPKVIYGRNGVGKSRLLHAIACALRGRRLGEGRVFLHASVGGGEATDRNWDGILPAILAGLNRELITNSERPDELAPKVADNDWWNVEDSYQSWTLLQLLRAHAEARLRRIRQPGIVEIANQLDANAYLAILAADNSELIVDDEVKAALLNAEALTLSIGGLTALAFSDKFIWEGLEVPSTERLVLEPTGSDTSAWTIWSGVDITGTNNFARDFRARVLRAPSDPGDVAGGLFTTSNADGSPLDGFESWSGIEDDYDLSPARVASHGPEVLDDWPTWASIPVMHLGSASGLAGRRWLGEIDVVNVAEVDRRNVDEITRRVLAARPGSLVDLADNDEVVLSADRVEAIAKLEQEASALFQTVASSAPPLSFVVGSPNRWFTGELAAWNAGGVPLSDLASSWQRWARIGIDVAVRRLRQRETESDADADAHLAEHIADLRAEGRLVNPSVLLVDEPELGLHRSAVAAVGELLNQFSQGGAAFAVTHSPQLLNARGVEALHLQFDRSTGRSQLHVPQLADIHSDQTMRLLAQELGLTRADLYQLVRVFVCVEGQHDMAVLSNLLEGSLGDSFAKILPLDGAKKLNEALTVPMIFDYTDANVVVVIDNSPEVEKDWNDLASAHQRGQESKVQAIIKTINDRPGGEAGWIA